MNKMGSMEKIIIGGAVVGMLIAGGYLLMPDTKIKRTGFVASNSIGYVKPMGPDVRLRGQVDPSWSKVRTDANVFQSDKVFTGNKSSALVSLKSNQKLIVEPNSLVVITDNIDSVYIDLSATGGFLGELKKGVKFFIKRDNTQIEMEGSGAVVSLSARKNEDLKVVVLKGAAQIKSELDKAPVQIMANTQVKVNQEKMDIEPLSIELQTPDASQIVWGQGSSVHFSWNSVGGKDQSASFIVDVARDPTFEAPIVQTQTQGTSASLSVPGNGVFFWRVREQGKNMKAASATSSFTTYPLLPPSIHEKIVIEVNADWRGQMKNPLLFGWNDPSLSEEYEFQMSADANFAEILYSEKTQDRQVQLSNLKMGTTYWRVTSYFHSRSPLISKVGVINVQSRAVESVPKAPIAQPSAMPRGLAQVVPVEAPVLEAVASAPPMTHEPDLVVATETVTAVPAPVRKVLPKPKKVAHTKVVPLKEAEPPVESATDSAREKTIEPLDKAAHEPIPETTVAEVEQPTPSSEQLELPVLAARKKPRATVYFGTGANFLSMQQNGTDNLESGKYSTLRGPTVLLGAQINLTDRTSLEFQYNSWPGEVRTDSASVVLRENKFDWQSYSAEYQYRFSDDGGPQYSVLLGLQNHQVPFLSTANDGVVDILQNEFLNASLGMKASLLSASGWEYEAFLRYQNPLYSRSANGYDFTATPNLMFDGSLGASKHFGENFKLGMYWFGQYQDFKYEFSRDGTPISGTQSFLNSNIQIRFGWEFLGVLSIGTLPLLHQRRKKQVNQQKQKQEQN